MQVAFLVFAGQELRDAIEGSKADWARKLRSHKRTGFFNADEDAAFYGQYSLLATDQGVRGWLQVTNDMCFVAAGDLELSDWHWDDIYDQKNANSLAATDEGAVNLALKSLRNTKVAGFLQHIALALQDYDWRTSSEPNLTDEQRIHQAVFRGSSGYKEMRRRILHHLAKASGQTGQVAKKVIKVLGYS